MNLFSKLKLPPNLQSLLNAVVSPVTQQHHAITPPSAPIAQPAHASTLPPAPQAVTAYAAPQTTQQSIPQATLQAPLGSRLLTSTGASFVQISPATVSQATERAHLPISATTSLADGALAAQSVYPFHSSSSSSQPHSSEKFPQTYRHMESQGASVVIENETTFSEPKLGHASLQEQRASEKSAGQSTHQPQLFQEALPHQTEVYEVPSLKGQLLKAAPQNAHEVSPALSQKNLAQAVRALLTPEAMVRGAKEQLLGAKNLTFYKGVNQNFSKSTPALLKDFSPAKSASIQDQKKNTNELPNKMMKSSDVSLPLKEKNEAKFSKGWQVDTLADEPQAMPWEDVRNQERGQQQKNKQHDQRYQEFLDEVTEELKSEGWISSEGYLKEPYDVDSAKEFLSSLMQKVPASMDVLSALNFFSNFWIVADVSKPISHTFLLVGQYVSSEGKSEAINTALADIRVYSELVEAGLVDENDSESLLFAEQEEERKQLLNVIRDMFLHSSRPVRTTESLRFPTTIQ